MERSDPVFVRTGDFVQFQQYGAKVDFPNEVDDGEYYNWLDEMVARIGELVSGAQIVEKEGDRSSPRRNSGVYYDTDDYRLLHGHMVLRTTSNPKTHAFCAFKYGVDANGVRRDHRFVFDGAEKLTIQTNPTSDAAVAVVKQLLSRHDIVHPGTILMEATRIPPRDLSPALLLVQDRRTFYVWLDGKDALRCSLDRADVSDLRPADGAAKTGRFSEIEVPIFPRISPDLLDDPRVQELIDVLVGSVTERFGVTAVLDSKYRRGARTIGLLG